MCHVRGTIKINKHKQNGCTLKKRLLLAANYNTMISHPLPRVFSFYNMAKAGKENSGFQSYRPPPYWKKKRDPGQRCIVGDVQMANSFHLNTGTATRNYRQRSAFQINNFGWEYLPVLYENSKWRSLFLKVIFFRKRHLCWGVSERFCGVILLFSSFQTT